MKLFAGVLMVYSLSASANQRVYSAESVQFYLNQISSMLAGRPLSADEINLTVALRQKSVGTIVRTWTHSPFISEAAKVMIETQMGLSGTAGGVDWNVPGYIVRHIVKLERPYSQIITADYCVNSSDQEVSCDSNAPFNAGLLTSRGFLVRNASRYNLSRANGMIRQFACLTYPMNREIQPSLPREQLIPLFQKDKDGGEEFGNGTACYNCHSQFGAHTQFFVKFDQFGNYQEGALGIQDPNGEPGRGPAGTFVSHLQGSKSSSNASNMFGKPAANLREAAKVLAGSNQFLACTIRNTIRYGLKLSATDAKNIPTSLIDSITAKIHAVSKDPTWQTIVEKTFEHPVVMESALQAGGQK